MLSFEKGYAFERVYHVHPWCALNLSQGNMHTIVVGFQLKGKTVYIQLEKNQLYLIVYKIKYN